MQGLNRAEALQHLHSELTRRNPKADLDEKLVQSVLATALDADLRFMEATGVLVGGLPGDAFYDDDEAYEAICDAVVSTLGLSEEAEMAACRIVDDYMDIFEQYLTSKGLIDWS